MDLEGTMLSEMSRIEKDKYHLMSLLCRIKNNEFIEIENRLVVVWVGRDVGNG